MLKEIRSTDNSSTSKRLNQQISDIRTSHHTRYHYMIVWERGQRLKMLDKRTSRIQRVCSPKTPQMPALSKINDNVQSERGLTHSKPYCSWIHCPLRLSSWNSLSERVAKRQKCGVSCLANRCILILYHGPRLEVKRKSNNRFGTSLMWHQNHSGPNSVYEESQ